MRTAQQPAVAAPQGKRRKPRKETKESLAAGQASSAARDSYIKSQESDMALETGAMVAPQAMGGLGPTLALVGKEERERRKKVSKLEGNENWNVFMMVTINKLSGAM